MCTCLLRLFDETGPGEIRNQLHKIRPGFLLADFETFRDRLMNDFERRAAVQVLPYEAAGCVKGERFLKIGQLAADGDDDGFADYLAGDEIFAASVNVAGRDFHAQGLYFGGARRARRGA